MTAGGWTVPDIISKVRNVTGTPSTDQLSNDQILTYINNYYVYTMPFEMKQQVQLDYIDFTTVAIQDTYPMPVQFLTNEPICWADGIFVNYYEDPNVFWKDFPQQYSSDPGNGTVDGTNKTFTGTCQSMQVIIGTFFVTDGVQVAIDNSAGILEQNGTAVGTINYVTGSWTVTFLSAPIVGSTIFDKYQAMVATRPQGVLFFQNQLTFRPIPDTVYQIRLQGYINPLALVNDSDPAFSSVYQPTFIEWGPCLAYGASMEIFADRGDTDGQTVCYNNLKRFEAVALARYVQQMQSQRPLPRF
jgi:hypothetical protein